ncbi:MAG: DUF3471 domain-containing protein [Planctomycetes bacterium]|nr:DUF3471 domain-containing protein [Planctomycetota bacterium]
MKLSFGLLLLLALCFLLGDAARACSAFLVQRDGLVLAGNNEDYWDPDTKVWFVPGDGKTYGRVCFGFGNGFPQGGLNERGLFFDGFATAPLEASGSNDKPPYPGNLIDVALAECATVAEVIALLERYNLGFLDSAMLMFGDQSGDAVIVERDSFVRKEGRYQVVTNFHQSQCDPSKYTCPRYRLADRMLKESKDVSVERCRRILAAVHAEGGAPTQYSMIYDLTHGIVRLYHFHNFENEVVIDLAEELKKGAHAMDLPSLFPETWAFTAFKMQKQQEVEKAVAARRAQDIDPATYEDYVGRYELVVASAGRWIIAISREGDRLLCRFRDGEPVEILPEAKDVFFHAGLDGSTTFRFERSAEGQVIRLKAANELRTYTAERLSGEAPAGEPREL